MLFTIFALGLGVLIFLFIFWRKLREDYSGGEIFNSALYVLAGIVLGVILADRFLPLGWFWLALAGALAGFGLGVLRYKFRIFETFEALVVGVLPGLSLFFLSDSIQTASVFSFGAFVLTVALIGIYYYLDRHYKGFSWYRSGRIGFSGLTVTGVFFLSRALFASFFPFMLSFVGQREVLLSAIVAFVVFLLIFNLARQEA